MATRDRAGLVTEAGPAHRQPDDDIIPAVGVLGTAAVIVPIAAGEPILRQPEREISILVARNDVTITHARYAAGQRVAGPHIHHEHTDAFYVLEGELTFEIGREAETIRACAGGLVAVPPGLAHSFRNESDRPARWLTIHAHDGGFAAFMRSTRDGGRVEWDIAPAPAHGGLPASEATVSPDGSGESLKSGRCLLGLRCTLSDLCIVEWHLHGADQDLPIPHPDRHGDTVFVLEGELDATLAGEKQSVGPGRLVSTQPGMPLALEHGGTGRARVLTLHTPDNGVAEDLRRFTG
jgi:quercetin dioxygenase-like cupin family protein